MRTDETLADRTRFGLDADHWKGSPGRSTHRLAKSPALAACSKNRACPSSVIDDGGSALSAGPARGSRIARARDRAGKKDAKLRTLQAADIAGIRALAVHAKVENAGRFYEHFGFIPSPTDALHPYVLVKDIKRLAPDERSAPSRYHPSFVLSQICYPCPDHSQKLSSVLRPPPSDLRRTP